MKILTYKEEFLPGMWVVVEAGPNEGTDHEANGRRGAIVKYGEWIAVELDRPPKYWKNPALLCPHNLRKVGRS